MDKQIKGEEKVSEKESNAGILIIATLKHQWHAYSCTESCTARGARNKKKVASSETELTPGNVLIVI